MFIQTRTRQMLPLIQVTQEAPSSTAEAGFLVSTRGPSMGKDSTSRRGLSCFVMHSGTAKSLAGVEGRMPSSPSDFLIEHLVTTEA